jgi:hypothetical protein
MATPFSHELKTFEELEQELQYFGKSNAATLIKYAISAPTASMNDGHPVENKERPIDIPRTLYLQPAIEDYENSSFIKRWWLWWATDISNKHMAYYYARANLILEALRQQQPLSSTEYQFITRGMRQYNRFSTLGSVYRALNSRTQLGLAIAPKNVTLPNALLTNKALPKSITLVGKLLNWLGFNQGKTTIGLTSTPNDVNQNPSIAKHAEFKKHFDEYKKSVRDLISNLEALTLTSKTSLRDITSLSTQLTDLKKKERGLMTMTHPDKNPGAYQATANANFQRIQSFIDWKTKHLEIAINSAANIDPHDRNSSASVMILRPSFNLLNNHDEGYHQEISQLLLNQQKTNEIAERIKKEYNQIRDEYRKKAEAARKTSERCDEIIRKLDAKNNELRKNLQLRKIAISLQTSTNPQEAPVASASNNTASGQINPTSISKSDDCSARHYYKGVQTVPGNSKISSQENHINAETLTPTS